MPLPTNTFLPESNFFEKPRRHFESTSANNETYTEFFYPVDVPRSVYFSVRGCANPASLRPLSARASSRNLKYTISPAVTWEGIPTTPGAYTSAPLRTAWPQPRPTMTSGRPPSSAWTDSGLGLGPDPLITMTSDQLSCNATTGVGSPCFAVYC